MPSVREVVDRIVELGIVDEATVREKLDPDDLDKGLDFFGDARHLLGWLGIGYTIDHKTFRHACEDDGEGYREELGYIEAATRGLLTITDIELVDDADGDHLLRFRVNGEPHEWSIAHGPDEVLAAMIEFSMSMSELTSAGRPECWCSIEPAESGDPQEFVFGDPMALRQLGAEYGMALDD